MISLPDGMPTEPMFCADFSETCKLKRGNRLVVVEEGVLGDNGDNGGEDMTPALQ